MSSAKTWLFLKPILTPNALASVQANPVILAYALATIGGLTVLISLAFFISFQTGKPYRKPKGQDKGGKGGEKKIPFVGALKKLPLIGKK
jgi:hypothetical protein